MRFSILDKQMEGKTDQLDKECESAEKNGTNKNIYRYLIKFDNKSLALFIIF